jgi:hypothetical protein
VCVGYGAEVLARIGATAGGLPARIGDLTPLSLAMLALAVPWSRRRCSRAWRPLSRGVSWSYAALAVLAFVWFAFGYFARQPVSWVGRGGPENDLLFALALAGEATHRWPLEFPWVQGEPLLYHWFFAEHVASAKELSGVGLPTLVLRLELLPAVGLVLLSTGAVATRLARRAWVGPLAAGLLFVVQDASPIPWSTLVRQPTADVFGVPYDVSFWWSTSGAFAAVVFAPVLILLVDAVREKLRPGGWGLLGLLVVVGVGAKASILPVVLVGTGWVVLTGWWVERRVNRSALAALVVSGLVFVVAWRTIYGAQSQSLVLGPLRYVMTTPLGSLVLGEGVRGRTALVLLLALVVAALALLVPVAGIGLLVTDKSTRGDPAGRLCLGMFMLGVAGIALLYHQGQSNLYFLRTAMPLLSAGAAWGLSTRVTAGAGRRFVRPALGAWVVGLALMAALSAHDWLVFGRSQVALSRLFQLVLPWLLVASFGALAAVAWRRSPARRQIGVGVLLVLLVAGAGSLRVVGQGVGWTVSQRVGWMDETANPSQDIEADGVRAATWIGAHSGPDDVIVTNALCTNGSSRTVGVCVNRTFWVAAYSERRTLVSGWGYTATANRLAAETGAVNNWEVPYWDRARWDEVRTFLADPTSDRAEALEQAGVRWVLVAPGYDEVSSRMGDVAELTYRAGEAAVYRLRAVQPSS